jgi:glycosyltransferase involved in cell wall biosynthesis
MGKQIIKVAVVCSYKLLPERIGGMDYFFWHFDQKCKENGIQVDWFFPNESRHDGYSALNIFSSEQKNVEKFFYKYCVANKPKYTHVITHFVELCTPIFKKIKEETKAKVIAVDHNPRPIEGYPLGIKIKKRLKGLLYVQYIDLFIGVSEYSRQHKIKEFGSNIRKKAIVIFNGIDVEKFKQKSNFEFSGKFIVAAHLRYEKGIQDLISAVNDLVKEQEYHFTIDLFGSGNYQNTLQEMVEEYNLQRYFRFKGSVTNLYERFADYDYLIHPSHGETFCYSIIESLLANLPVITTKNEGNVLGMVKDKENGFLFEREDTNELKNILKNILNRKVQINDCTELNKAVQVFSLEKMVENYINLIY